MKTNLLRNSRSKVLALVFAGLLAASPAFPAGPPKAVARAAAKRLSIEKIVKTDSQRHLKAQVKLLERPRTVHRYTSKSRALWEQRHGVPAGSHMTASAAPGRPLSPEAAQKRFGLLRKPGARLTIQLPKDFPVRINPATNASRGIHEITSPKAVRPENIKKVVLLK